MATYIATRAGTSKPSAGGGLAQDLKRAWGTIEYGAAFTPAVLDQLIMCKLPKGAMIVGGSLQGDKIDNPSTGSGLLSINIGLDKAITTATGTTVTAASTSNALASAWTLGTNANAVTGYKPDSATYNLPLGGLLLTDGPLLTSDETNAYIVTTTTWAVASTGTLTLYVDYYTAQQS